MAIQGTFTSVTGAELDKRLWPADGEAKGIVQLVHGMAEHIDRYDETAQQLNRAGYTVVGHTHLGHGARAELKGYFAAKNGWDAVVEDVHRLRQDTQAAYPGLSYFLLGHSMGSFVVRTYCLKYEAGLAGVIISGTRYCDKPTLASGALLAKLQCAFGMGEKPSRLLDSIGFSANNKSVENPRTACDWLSRDPEHVDKYVADPLCGFLFTARGFADMFGGMLGLASPECLNAMIKNTPVLLISGDRDPVGGCGKGVRRVYEQFQAAGLTDVTMKLYPGARHELFNETNRQEVWADLIAWLNEKLDDKQ